MEKVLVAGATGTTGKKVVKLLDQSKKYKPIAMVRKEAQMSEFSNKNIEVVLADLEGDVRHTIKNVDKIVFAAGSGGKKVKEVDQEGAKKMIDAGKAADVKKFVMLSSMGADNPDEATDLKEYLKAKHNADEYLKASLLPYTIVRPGRLTNEAGTGKINASYSIKKEGAISRDDVAKTLVQTLDNDTAYDSSFEILSGKVPIDKAVEELG